MPFRKTSFQIDGGKAYVGYTSGQTWNGWECPYFEKDVAEKILQDIVASDETFKVIYDAERDVFITVTDGEEDYVDEWKTIMIKYDGALIKTYGIGAGCWVWDEVEDTECRHDCNGCKHYQCDNPWPDNK